MKEVVGVDLGGTHIRAGLVHGNKIVNFVERKTPRTKSEIVNALKKCISEVINSHVVGIGVAAPGPLDKGVIINTPNLPFRNFDLQKALKKKFHKKIVIENDAHCVALAEYVYGTSKRNFFVLTLGTGIGGGVVIDGRLLHRTTYGSELGAIVLDDGKTFEELAGGLAIGKLIKKELGKKLEFSEVVKRKDRKSKKIVDQTAGYIGQGVGSLVNVFNPEIVVLSGGFSKSGNDFLKKIKSESKKYILLPKKPNIVWSSLKEPGILGASLLVS